MKIAESVACGVESRVFAFLAFDGARLALVWRLGAWEKAYGRWQRAERPGKATQSHLKAISKPPQSHHKAIY
jgi:hypothetical protein